MDVGWEDLKKAARSYRSDPRFNQFAKRRLSEQAFGNQSAHSPAAEKNGKTFWLLQTYFKHPADAASMAPWKAAG